MKKLLVALGRLIAVATAVLAGLAGVGAAQALTAYPPDTAPTAERLKLIGKGVNSCPRGYLCAWEHEHYRGRGVAIFGKEWSWNDFPPAFRFIDDNAESYFNNGYGPGQDPLPDVCVYPDPDFQGAPLPVRNGQKAPSLGLQNNTGSSNRWLPSGESC